MKYWKYTMKSAKILFRAFIQYFQKLYNKIDVFARNVFTDFLY